MKFNQNDPSGQCRKKGEAPSRLVGENPEVSVSSTSIGGTSVARVGSLVFWTRLFLGVVFVVASADKILRSRWICPDGAQFSDSTGCARKPYCPHFTLAGTPDRTVPADRLLAWRRYFVGQWPVDCVLWISGIQLGAWPGYILRLFWFLFTWKNQHLLAFIRDMTFLLMGAYLFHWHFFTSNNTESLQNQGETSTSATGKGEKEESIFCLRPSA